MSFDKNQIKPFYGSLALIPAAIFLILNEGRFIFILDHINLLFHEGGHGIFKIFGKFIYTLGGSIMQLIIPSLFIYYFASNKKRFATQISILYLAQNIMNVSVYIGDATSKNLPLLGGNKVYHDWDYILRKLDILSYDKTIAGIVYIIAVLIILFSLILPFIWKDYKSVKLNLNIGE